MELYHFTSAFHLPMIQREGISRGDVPTTPFGGFNAPWFTTDPNPQAQGWSEGAGFAKDIRLTVEIPDDDPNLRKWTDVIKAELAETAEDDVQSRQAWFDILNDIGGKGQDNWYIYMGVIPPALIKDITYPS